MFFLTSDTEQIQQEIKRVLPELDVNKLQDVVNHLCFVVGVQKTQDLALVEVTDLQDFLFPIQCRKLLMDFKQRGKTKNAAKTMFFLIIFTIMIL